MGVLRPRTRAKGESNAGFTLVEVVVAMGIAGIVLAALLGATISAARASILARTDQQAGDLLTKTLEDLRSLDYGAMALPNTAVAADLDIVTSAQNNACPAFACWEVPNGIGLEPVVLAPTGAVNPHISEITANANNVTFTLSRYITQPPGENTRRITAIVEWDIAGSPYRREVSTIVANTRRGLPLPKFTVATGDGGVTVVNQGGMLQVPFIIKNLGARDAFDLRVLSGGVNQPGWVIYPDDACSGGLDPDVMPSPLPATGGVQVTPDLFPDSITCYIATFETGNATPLTTYPIVVKGQSTKQPEAESAVITTDPVTVSVQAGVVVEPTPNPTATGSPTASPTPTPAPSSTQVCSTPNPSFTPPNGYTIRRFVLQNDPPGDTATIPVNPLQRDSCGVQLTSRAFSTQLSGEIGRAVNTGGNTNQNGGDTVAEWRWLAPVITDIRGTAVVRFAYKCTGTTASLQVALGDYNQTLSTAQWTARATTTATVSCNGNWGTAEVTLSVNPAFSLRSKSGSGAVPTHLSLRIAAPTGAGMRLNYDSPSAPSTMFVGIKP